MSTSPSSCRSCGAALTPGKRFCEQCGAVVINEPYAPPTGWQGQPSEPPARSSSFTPLPYTPPPPPPVSIGTARPYITSFTPPAPKKRMSACLIVGLVLLFGGLCLTIPVGGYFLYTKFNIPMQTATPPEIGQLPTPTHTATSTESPPSDAITVEGCVSADDCPDATLINDLFGKDKTLENNIEYKVTISADKKVRFNFGWCATTRKILDENLNSVKFVFTIDDAYIENIQKEYYDTQDSSDPTKQNSCYKTGGMVSGWQEGHTYRVVFGMTIDKPIFDGWNTYPKSDRLRIYLISIDSNASVQPAAPTSEDSGIPACPGAPPSRLNKGDHAQVVNTGGYSLILYDKPQSNTNEVAAVQEGNWVIIRDGPICAEKSYWWMVEFGEGGQSGWGVEATSEGIYLLEAAP